MSGVPGMGKHAPMKAGQARSRIWQSMRMLRQFTAADLVSVAEAGESNVQRYLDGLRSAGYVAEVAPVQSGRTGGYAVWRLVKNTGPHAPRICRRGLTDPNLRPRPATLKKAMSRGEYQRALRCIAYAQQRAAAGDEAAQYALRTVA